MSTENHGVTDLENIYNFGPRQSFPTDIAELLNTSDFKIEFLCFLFKEFEDPIYGPIIREKGNDNPPSFNRKGRTKPITVINKY